jgi:hypothetical protein
MSVYFKDEEKYVRLVKYNNATGLREAICEIKDPVILIRLFELSLKMVRPSSFKTLYFHCPRYAPANPITILTSTFINYKKDRQCEKYYGMVEDAVEIFNFLLEYDLCNKVDCDWATEWALYEDMNDLPFLK